MSISFAVVGAGYGRTGTLSAKAALERLGFGPCYHMSEVMAHPEYAQYWLAAASGQAVDWDIVMRGYRSSVDWPACNFYRELAAHFSEAKVLLTVRDMRKWYESCAATIIPAMKTDEAHLPPQMRVPVKMARTVVVDKTFGGNVDDAAHCIAVHEAHIRDVKRTFAPERLLVFDVAQGWGPLCKFLNVPVPPEPFPRVNTREEFIGRVAATRGAGQ
jgi:hypothetical protein